MCTPSAFVALKNILVSAVPALRLSALPLLCLSSSMVKSSDRADNTALCLQAFLVIHMLFMVFGSYWSKASDNLTKHLCPSRKASQPESTPKPTVFLLEHDHRFGIFPEFTYYDFAQPVKLPGEYHHPTACENLSSPSWTTYSHYHHCSQVIPHIRLLYSPYSVLTEAGHLKASVDRFVIDPPFLSEDCQTKMALTVRWMAKKQPAGDSKVIISTGERMESLVTKLYRSFGLRTTNWAPVHAHGLSNEFYCYANFECDKWKWKAADGVGDHC